MRQWHVDPRILCTQHLLGEHVEHHMYAGAIKRGISLRGYLDRGQVAIHTLKARHDVLVLEMKRRGMKHKSPFPDIELRREGTIDSVGNLQNLLNRCTRCKDRFNNWRVAQPVEQSAVNGKVVGS